MDSVSMLNVMHKTRNARVGREKCNSVLERKVLKVV